jgi:hypothetical protein
MGSGVLAYKTKKERLKPLFFMLDTFHARQPAGVIENSKLQAVLLVASVGGVAALSASTGSDRRAIGMTAQTR